ncbi:MAG: dCTP deaminase [Methanomassiliicoccales archaeon]|nr:MAG: dCTP deaminase [Methanomassiliicoccales archaeon]
MCIIPDHEIVVLLRQGALVIEPFSEDGLTPNGYDLRVAEVRPASSMETVREGVADLAPGSMSFVSTLERVELPDDVSAQLWTRTSWIRKGLLVGLGKVDAGFHGTLTFMVFNASSNIVELPIGSRFVQIVFETMRSKVAMTYEKRSGNYQDQKGITLEPVKKL